MLLNSQIKENFNVAGDGNNRGGLPIRYENGKTYVCSEYHHNLIIGETGSKKSRLISMPMVVNLLDSKENIIVTDPKGEIYRNTVDIATENNYNIIKLDFTDFDNSDSWNPLKKTTEKFKKGNYEEAWSDLKKITKKLSQSIHTREDNFWENASNGYLENLFKLFYITEKSDFTLAKFVEFYEKTKNYKFQILPKKSSAAEECEVHSPFNNDPTDKTDLIITLSDDKYIPILKKLKNFIAEYRNFESSKTTSCIKQTVEAVFVDYGLLDKKMLQIFSEDSLDFKKFDDENIIIYLIIPDYTNAYNSIIGWYLKSIYEEIMKLLSNKGKEHLDIRLNYILDEFANIPRIEDFNAWITAGRSRNIRFTLLIQSISQLNKYDIHKETIINNCGNIVYLYSREPETLKIIGNYVDNLISLTGLKNLRRENGETIMLLGRNKPYLATLVDISDVLKQRNKLKKATTKSTTKNTRKDTRKDTTKSTIKDLKKDVVSSSVTKEMKQKKIVFENKRKRQGGNMDVKRIKEIEENINKNITELQNLSKEISKEFGTRIELGQNLDPEFGYNDEYVSNFGNNIKISVKVPRAKGDEFLSIFDELTYDTPNLKEVVLKMRAVEKLADEHDPDNSEGIWLEFGLQDFMEKTVDEIYTWWRIEYHKWDDEM